MDSIKEHARRAKAAMARGDLEEFFDETQKVCRLAGAEVARVERWEEEQRRRLNMPRRER